MVIYGHNVKAESIPRIAKGLLDLKNKMKWNSSLLRISIFVKIHEIFSVPPVRSEPFQDLAFLWTVNREYSMGGYLPIQVVGYKDGDSKMISKCNQLLKPMISLFITFSSFISMQCSRQRFKGSANSFTEEPV